MKSDLVDASDLIAHIESLVEALFMASGDVADKDQLNALQTVASITLRCISDLAEIINTMRLEPSK